MDIMYSIMDAGVAKVAVCAAALVFLVFCIAKGGTGNVGGQAPPTAGPQ